MVGSLRNVIGLTVPRGESAAEREKALLQFHSVVLPTERISSIIGFVFWPSTSHFQ